ncbi:hypothetical protein MPER_01321 [Moniliophthora perniciosa FA553]|nr:hypothetical protein MPER_01321 [Moniliophthora perniciosa FA553]
MPGSVNRNSGTPVEELERAERRILLANNLQREGEKLFTVLTEIKEFVEWLPSRYFITTWLTTSNSGKIHAFMARLYEALEDFKYLALAVMDDGFDRLLMKLRSENV